MAAVSIEIPGLIVEASVTLRRYLPFAVVGLALSTAFNRVLAFSTNLPALKLILPTGTCTMPVLSVRNSTLPAFSSLTAFAISNVTVPVLGLGISPRGPSTLPKRGTVTFDIAKAVREEKAGKVEF